MNESQSNVFSYSCSTCCLKGKGRKRKKDKKKTLNHFENEYEY